MKQISFIIVFFSFITGIYSQLARVQVIHNSADLAIAVVDVYINGTLAVGDAAFRTASPFSDVPAGIPLSVAIAPGDSTGPGDAFYTENRTFTSGESYIIIAAGIVSATGYNPSPPFTLEVFDVAREVATNPANVDVLLYHGSTDAPIFDVYETGQGLGEVADDFAYTDYAGYLELPTADYIVELRDATGTQPLAAYVAPLESSGAGGSAITVVASGFWDPSQNSNGPAFGLYAASPLGGNMVPLPPSPLGLDDFSTIEFSVYPNPTSDLLQFSGHDLLGLEFQITEISGRIIKIDSLEQNEGTIDVSYLSDGVYILSLIDANDVLGTIKFIKD